nr:radical SAM protein [Lachnospiraceae bacterium]
TSHPKDMSDELIETMAKYPKVCRHVHLPLQSGSDRILKAMNRHYTKADYMLLVEKLRKAMPDISLTTDIIVGFPGETEEDFLQTIEVVREVKYDSAFTFIYSKRPGTPAARIEDDTPEEVIHERFNRLLALVQETAAERVGRFEGSIQEVLVEGPNDHDPSMVTGRTANNIVVHFPGDPGLIGSIVNVRLDETHGFYYTGTMM